MFDFLKRKKKNDQEVVKEAEVPAVSDETAATSTAPSQHATAAQPTTESQTQEPAITIEKPTAKTGFFARLKQGLTKTRSSLTNNMANLFLGKKTLTRELVDDIEMALLTADVGVETTDKLIKTLTDKLARKELDDPETAFNCLKSEMKAILSPYAKPIDFSSQLAPFVILVVGINGSGKTTTIGKLAHFYQQQGKKLMLAAGDTFRAAAVQQLQIWGERNHVPVIAQQTGADTAAVIYDAVEAAKARETDILLADTAGRLHTQTNLMTELQKVARVMKKVDPSAPHETLIVLDATLGQNALTQVKQFNEALGVTGIVLTKLDGTAKGGIIFSIAQQTKLPIRFIGVGEGIDDLRPFNPDEFVEALFAKD